MDLPKNRRTGPLVLAPDNFTPPSRTPWGGTKILGRYKRDVEIAEDKRYDVVGESWEISVEPDFPSVTADEREPLAAVIARDPAGLIGREARLGRTATALLVKLLDAADALSVQIHPRDDDPALARGESGKPESWYVLEHEPDAALYLGLRDGVARAQMEHALRTGADVSQLLMRVPVEPGDFFVIEAGTPHAIGAGVTLIEPQHVSPGRRGVTYRYWDWNRLYAGKPRELHVERALDVTDWRGVVGDAFVERIRKRAGTPELDGEARLDALAGARPGAVAFAPLDIARLSGTGELVLEPCDALRGLVVAAGEARLVGESYDVRVPMGRAGVIPAAAGAVRCELTRAHALVAYVTA